MQISSHRHRVDMDVAAAAAIAAALRCRLAQQAHARMIFAAAPSQSGMLENLTRATGIEWQRVTAFHLDEYIGLPEGAPERFASWLDQRLFERLPFGAVHRLKPEPDPQAAAADYARLLAQAPVDIVCLGIGVNGHLAFNDPPVADFADPLDVKIVNLDPACRQQQVDDACFASLDRVPAQALTLTIPRLLRARQLFCVVPGRQKRDAVRKTLYDAVSTACPATALRGHSDCTLFLDGGSDARS